jgi:lysosomal acid lipase/cholesteryl ester hydrolase
MGRYDLPANISYILEHTGFERLGYVGFSQGAGQAFACFALQQDVAAKINLFVSLSPAAKARGLNQGLLQTLVKIAPQSLFLFFGTRVMMSTAEYWRAALSRTTYAHLIDRSCHHLFAWKMHNIGNPDRKNILYSHLFSFASVKTVVHWFQIAVCDRFQVYDENQNFSRGYQAICPMSYPIRQIKCPMAIFYGGSDELTDIPWLLSKMPPSVPVYVIGKYEHLDLIWATDAHTEVFPEVCRLLQGAARGEMVRAIAMGAAVSLGSSGGGIGPLTNDRPSPLLTAGSDKTD